MENLIGMVIGGCRIESKIGHGGMGTVYKAHHLGLAIPVAVKILQPQSTIDNPRDRFLREARIAARLNHPHIVRILNVSNEHDLDFIVMEFIDGKNLREKITDLGTIPPEDAIRITIEILGALEESMRNGIVHRDIKPENILIDSSETAKLADLGLARCTTDRSLTQSSTVLGSPYYVAPEQVDNPAKADIRADIYSLGCTLFHMVSGCTPFQGSSPVEIILNHTRMPVPRLRDIKPSLPSALDEIVFRMMQKEPQKRYQTPSEVIAAFSSEYQPASSTAIRQPSPPLKKARSRIYVPALAAVALILVAIVGVLRNREPANSNPTPDLSTKPTSDSTPAPSSAQPAMPDKSAKAPPVKKTVTRPKNESDKQAVTEPKHATKDPLLASVKIGDTEATKRLLEQGVSARGYAGTPSSPLHESVRRGSTDITQLLVQHGADPNVLDNRGLSPLHYAVKEDARLMAGILLKHGANPNLKDRQGKTPMQIAGQIGSEIESMLRDFGGN